MRRIVESLIEDTERQLPLLEMAVKATDAAQCARLAHYSKGACANIGAVSAAGVLSELERCAKRGALEECSLHLIALGFELERLRTEEI